MRVGVRVRVSEALGEANFAAEDSAKSSEMQRVSFCSAMKKKDK